jgi:hypothetical protein
LTVPETFPIALRLGRFFHFEMGNGKSLKNTIIWEPMPRQWNWISDLNLEKSGERLNLQALSFGKVGCLPKPTMPY